MSRQAVYVYAVGRRYPAAQAPVRGVGGAPVELVTHGDLAAVVSHVPLDQFGEAGLRANLERLEWVEAVARAHHGVIDAVAAHTTVLPLRLVTIYHDTDRVAGMLRERQDALAAALDRVAGRLEWGVKVYADPERLPGPQTAAAPGPAAGPGRTYLRRRQRQRDAREHAWQQAAELGRQVDAALTPLVEDVRHHRAQDPTLSGAPGENVLNAAYLVRKDRSDGFLTRVRELADARAGVRVELTGPWVPYSFAPAAPVPQPRPGQPSS